MACRLYSKRIFGKYDVKRGFRQRPRSFLTLEAAKVYTELKGIKGYSIEQKRKKFVINLNS